MARSGERPGAIAVVGISSGDMCGVRDHAELLARELEREHVACELRWLRRRERSLRGSRAEIRAWTRQLAEELAESRPQAILLHYSVFSYSYKGVPLFVRPTLAALRASRVPVLAFMHELAYPLGRGGLRGRVWALSQRAVLREVVDASAALIVTADFRSSWLASRRWLPRRRLLVAPVFPTIPAPRAVPAVAREQALVGLFGYAHESTAVTLVLEAMRELRERGMRVRLSLLGAPGRSSAAGEAWAAAARAADVAELLSFSGPLPAQELSDALARCDVLVFADVSGPSSRKTTLAAALASGVPLVAIDGPRTWQELVRCHAAAVVEPTSAALSGAVAELLADETQRRALGTRGRSFAEREMAVAGSARAVRTLLGETLSARCA